MEERVIIIAGLGDSAAAWEPVRQRLADSYDVDVLTLGQLGPSGDFSVDSAANALAARLGGQAESTHLVGLSAGAVIALRCAAQHTVGSLFLSAPQIKAPKALIKLQNFVFRLLPQRAFASSGLSKEDMTTYSHALAEVNLSGDARAITAPTTIACGSRDRANLPAARKAHGLIAQSRLLIIDKVGHEWHRQAPDIFAAKLVAHIQQS